MTLNTSHTPKLQTSKKRELTSPEFDVDYKKNRPVSESGSEVSESVSSELPPLPESPQSPRSKSIDSSTSDNNQLTTMASGHEQESSVFSEGTASTPHLMIPPSEMLKLSEMLKDTFRSEIVHLVDSVVTGVLSGLQERIISLEKANRDLSKENISLTARVAALEAQVDQAEQYSRRNCLRISGIHEEKNENTDDIVLRIASDIGSSVQAQDIDRSHRIGNPNSPRRTRPREIIVKFSTYRARASFIKCRTALKNNNYLGVFVNEDLTKKRSSYLYQARLLVKSQRLNGAWSSDGTILIKDNNDRVHRINSLNDLIPFGYKPSMTNYPGRLDQPIPSTSGGTTTSSEGHSAMHSD